MHVALSMDLYGSFHSLRFCRWLFGIRWCVAGLDVYVVVVINIRRSFSEWKLLLVSVASTLCDSSVDLQ